MNDYEDIEHGLFGTTKKRANAKYVAKIPMGNGKFRYFYSQNELRAYNAAKKINRAVANVNQKIKNNYNEGKRNQQLANKFANEEKKHRANAAAADKTISDLRQRASVRSKHAGKTSQRGSSYRNSPSKNPFNEEMRVSYANAEKQKGRSSKAADAMRKNKERAQKKADKSIYSLVQKGANAVNKMKKMGKAAASTIDKGKKAVSKLPDKILDAAGRKYQKRYEEYDNLYTANKKRSDRDKAISDAYNARSANRGAAVKRAIKKGELDKVTTKDGLTKNTEQFAKDKKRAEEKAEASSIRTSDSKWKRDYNKRKYDESLYGKVDNTIKKFKKKKKKK